MVKKIKFVIELNGVTVDTLEKLRANFNLKQIIEYLFDENKTLWRFLDVRGCEKEAAEIAALKPDTPELQARLYEIFGFEQPTEERTIDVAETAEHKKRLDRLMAFTDNRTILDSIDRVAFDQAELNNLADSGVEEIYLCDGRFEIPLDKTGKTYVGVDGAAKPVAVIRSEKIVDFEKLDIRFKNLPFDDAYKKITESPAAMFELGKSYYEAKNYTDAVSWLQKAVEKNYEDAMYLLGMCYYFGHGVKEDNSKAFELFQKAAEKNHVDAMFRLGICYYNGEGISKNYGRAFELFQKAAEKNHLNAMFRLGACYYYGRGVDKDEVKAFELFNEAAEKNHLNAIYHLGECYYKGRGVNQDYTKAFECFQKAASENHHSALFFLGECYYLGRGVKEDNTKAFELFKKVEEGWEEYFTYAISALGMECYFGLGGVKENNSKAFECFQKAAKKNDVDATFYLGRCYYLGHGVKEDYAQAFECFQKTAEKNNFDAMYWLGMCYYLGRGVKEDNSKAFELFQKAAEKNNVTAMFRLGECYYKGFGTAKNNLKALEWFQKAADKGDSDAKKILEEPNFTYSIARTYKENGSTTLALEWFKKSAEKGFDLAMAELYSIYTDYFISARDDEHLRQAKFWRNEFRKADHTHNNEQLQKICYDMVKALDEQLSFAEKYNNNGTHRGNSDNGCFITTALCQSFNKPDDCRELTAFRNFRDNFLASEPDGKALIAQYYETAPQIVRRIDAQSNATEIYRSIWTQYLAPCLNFLDNGDNLSCKARYVEMVSALQKKFH